MEAYEWLKSTITVMNVHDPASHLKVRLFPGLMKVFWANHSHFVPALVLRVTGHCLSFLYTFNVYPAIPKLHIPSSCLSILCKKETYSAVRFFVPFTITFLEFIFVFIYPSSSFPSLLSSQSFPHLPSSRHHSLLLCFSSEKGGPPMYINQLPHIKLQWD